MGKKILHVVNISFVLPYYIGDQFDFFREKGYDISVTCSPSEHLIAYAKEKKLVIFPIKVLREISPIEDIKSIWKLVRIIRSNKIDIVIGHTPKGALLAMISGFLANVKQRIYFRHGLMFETSEGLKRQLLIFIERLTGRLAIKVVNVSSSVIEKSIKLNLNNPKKNILLNKGTCNGINLDKMVFNSGVKVDLMSSLGIRSEDRVVGYVGRLVKDKGVEELLTAWEIITSKFDDVKLLLIGPFEERDSISDRSKEIIYKSNTIIHTGLILDVLPYYGLMNVFILPSRREGFPTVVLEASSMGLPIITTKATGCIDSIIENETGVFCEIDPNDISEKIGFYLKNGELAVEHGRNGINFVLNNFKQEIIWKEIESKVLEIY